MALSSGQLPALKAAILADPTSVTLQQQGATGAIAERFNTPSGSAWVWRSKTPTDEVFESISWANLTPADAPDGSQEWLNRAIACQGKQFNLQTMLTGRENLATGKPRIRSGLQDALTNIPSDTGGGLRAAGWVDVREKIKRLATRAEAIFWDVTGGNGAQATPATLVFEGSIDELDVIQALALP